MRIAWLSVYSIFAVFLWTLLSFVIWKICGRLQNHKKRFLIYWIVTIVAILLIRLPALSFVYHDKRDFPGLDLFIAGFLLLPEWLAFVCQGSYYLIDAQVWICISTIAFTGGIGWLFSWLFRSSAPIKAAEQDAAANP